MQAAAARASFSSLSALGPASTDTRGMPSRSASEKSDISSTEAPGASSMTNSVVAGGVALAFFGLAGCVFPDAGLGADVPRLRFDRASALRFALT